MRTTLATAVAAAKTAYDRRQQIAEKATNYAEDKRRELEQLAQDAYDKYLARKKAFEAFPAYLHFISLPIEPCDIVPDDYILQLVRDIEQR